MSKDVRFLGRALCAPALLAAAATHTSPAAADVIANDIVLAVPDSLGSNGGTLTFNITEQSGLVDGTSRPVQLLSADLQAGDANRNCITVVVPPNFGSSGSSLFVAFTVTEGGSDIDLSFIDTDSGSVTLVPSGGTSSVQTVVPVSDQRCGDAQFNPIAAPDVVQAMRNQMTAIAVLANDLPQGLPGRRRITFGFDQGTTGLGEARLILQSTTAQGGTVVANRADGTILYTPASGFVGQDTFQYTVADYVVQGFEPLNATSMVVVNVVAPPMQGPPPLVQITVNGGTISAIADTDFLPGETVRFDASQSSSSSGAAIVQYDWFIGDATSPAKTGLANDPTFSPQLPDGQSNIRLVVTDANGAMGTANLQVTVGVSSVLAAAPNLTPNQAAVAATLDRVCTDLAQRQAAADQSEQPSALTDDQQDLLARCQGVLTTDNLALTLEELSAQDFNGARTQALLFTNAIYAGVQDRLMALRGGARGASLAGLNLVIDGKSVPLAQIGNILGKILGGGAAADDERGSLLGDKWGTWTRGNFTFGEKDRSGEDNGFEADQYSLVVGVDYRLSGRAVVGTALSFGASNVSYSPGLQGGIDTKSYAASFYGSRYVGKRYYLDAVLNVAKSNYDAERRITYVENLSGAAATLDRTANGDTDGLTVSGGLSGGFDYSIKGFSITPSIGVLYSQSSIDSFRERGAGGLDLQYDKQSFQSLTANLGFRTSYTANLSWGVIIPYLGADYVRELQNNVEVFNVRFASDPVDPTPPIEVRANDPDQSYFRLTGGVSAQFRFGISSYVEYQRLQSFEFVHFTDLAMGVRLQYSLR